MASSPSLGRTLGRYELGRRIATGGMAEVYLARSPRSTRPVVVKRMLPELARDPQFVDMFLAEARIAARLDHPNIVRVEDVGEENGELFIVMEYVRGADLLQMMRVLSKQDRTIPLEHAVSIASGICSGLSCAHDLVDAHGRSLALVHRDVSLPNILVSYDGDVKLADFGVAQVADREQTRAGVLKGKLGYMSPEQCRGKPLDLRSDIFSLGIVLYEMTTGERVFAGGTDYEVLERVIACDVPPPSCLVRGYPLELEAIVMTALQRDRDQRYQSARDMQCDLEAFLRVHRMTSSQTALGELVAEIVPMTPRRSTAQAAPIGRGTGEDAALPTEMPPALHLPVPASSLRAPIWRRVPIAVAAVAVLLAMIVCVWAAFRTAHAPDEISPLLALSVPSPQETTITSSRSHAMSAPPPPAPVHRTVPKPRVLRSLDAAPAISSLHVRGRLPATAVRYSVERIFGELRGCYRTAAKARGAPVPTTVRLAFEIGENRTARAVYASGGIAGLAGCTRTAAAQIRTRLAPDAGSANVVLTIAFTPR